MALVDARGVAGAVSGNLGGDIFIGSGNKDARCLFRRGNLKRALAFEAICGFGAFAKVT